MQNHTGVHAAALLALDKFELKLLARLDDEELSALLLLDGLEDLLFLFDAAAKSPQAFIAAESSLSDL